jgi:hypothetical protein
MAFKYSPKIVTDGLVLCLDAANPKSIVSGSTTWNDLSREGKTGTLVNGPVFSSTNGGSIVFDGSNDYVTLPNLNVGGASPRSINIWVKSSSNNTIYTLFGFGVLNELQSNILHINVANSGNVYWGFNNADFYTTSNTIDTTNYWNICATYNGGILNGNVSIYVNGISKTLTKTGNLWNSPANTVNSNYGIASDNGIRFFNGNISSIQIYNRALRAEEVLQNYNTTKSRYGL